MALLKKFILKSMDSIKKNQMQFPNKLYYFNNYLLFISII